MDKHLELVEWFKRMGYDGRIPESLGNICNNSTSFIWDQLVQNAKPKQEVDNMRNNIIIHRLRRKPLSKQDEFSYRITEIDQYIKRQYVEKKLSNLKNIVEEEQRKFKNLSQNNKMKYVTIEQLKSRVKENEQREYLLRNKCKIFEKDIQDAEDILTCAKNLTPVELDENSNTKEITETLQKCAEKLEKLLQNMPTPSNSSDYSQNSFRQFQTAQKQPNKQSTFEKWLILSERKHSERITIFKQEGSSINADMRNKENLCSNKKINKNLFSDFDNQASKKGIRESLGILHDSFLKDNIDINFLNVESTELFSPVPNVSKPVQSKKFSFEPKMLLNVPQCSMQRGTHFEILYNDEFSIRNLRNLLYSHNRCIIWNAFQTLTNNLNLDLTQSVTWDSGNNLKNQNISEDDIAKIRFIHVLKEFQTLRVKAVSRDFANKIDRKKKQIYSVLARKMSASEKTESIIRLFEDQVEDVSLDVTLAEMKKEINSTKKNEDNSDLQIILDKIAQTREDIIQGIATIKHYVNSVHETLQSTIYTREQAFACVRKQRPFVEDLTWAALLTERLCSGETKMFEKFPLEYNRRCVYTDPRIYYRDLTNNIPTDIDLDSDGVYMLTSILESPFSPPETVLLNILKSRMKLNILTSLQNYSPSITYEKYSLKDLQAQENYIQYALDKLNSIIYSTSASKTLATANAVKKIMEIWVEMPLKDFISPSRTLEGKDYKFYEKQYDSFYNNF